jgi:PAS domain S-box-containing protein
VEVSSQVSIEESAPLSAEMTGSFESVAGATSTSHPWPLKNESPTLPGTREDIDLLECLRERCARVRQTQAFVGRLEFVANGISTCAIRADTAALISLIVGEALTNAIQYSHPAGVPGVITVDCARGSDGSIAIDVADDGVGLPENFDPAKDGGVGLQTIRTLSDRLGGHLAFDSSSLGLRIRLELPRRVFDSCVAPLTLVANDKAESGKSPKAATTTRQKRAAMDNAAAQRLAAIVESSHDAILSKDLNGIITSWNRGASHLFGYSAEELIGKSVTILIPKNRHDEEPVILDRIRRGEQIKDYETVRVRKDGSVVDVSLSVSPIKDLDGRIVGASKIARDITERKQAQARQELLTRELNHRTKNLFAVIQSIVSRSFAGKKSLEDAKTAVLGRLYALSQANALLMGEDFRGANIANVVDAELSPYRERAVIEGPPLVLSAQAAQNISLVVHELATNAAKYGALSVLSGNIAIHWAVLEECGRQVFVFRWKEAGGPLVHTPDTRGFGSTVLERVMADYFEGSPRVDFAPSGVTYELKCALDAISNGK